jgi:MFS family permease
MSRELIRAHQDFRRLWIGDGIAKLGSGVVVVAMPVLAATMLDASAWEVGLLTTFAGLPYLLIGLPVGAWSDRVRRRPVLVAADLWRAAVLCWVPVGAALGMLAIWQLYLVVLLVGVGTVFFDVSQGAYLPTLVGRHRLVEANSRLEVNRAVAYATGPTVGGQLATAAGAPLALIATIAGYLWSAAWIAAIRTPEPVAPRGARHLLREIREGIRVVLGNPFIRATTFHATVAVLCLSTRYAVEVLFLLRTVGLSAAGVGVLITLAGLGAIAGALLAGRIAGRLGRIRTVAVSGVAMGGFGLLIPMTGAGLRLACFAVGAGMVAFWIVVNNVVAVSVKQMLCPDKLLGRMNATSRFLAWAALPLGGVVGGALGTVLGLRAALWLAAAGLLAASLLLVLPSACPVRDLPSGREPSGDRLAAVPG